MEHSNSSRFDIYDSYRRFCDIKSGNLCNFTEGENMLNDDSGKAMYSRDAMAVLSNMVDLNVSGSVSVLDELQKLMLHLNIRGGFSEFSNFYEFTFFMCRENGQKNITVSRATAAWKLVLAGRFRLLNQWCDFVEKNQRYNISEDTWRQLLAFSRCVHENLEGYDPEGAWPTLIDDFVEHMYRITGSNNCSSCKLTCHCGDPEDDSLISNTPCPGLRNLPGLKRKSNDEDKRTVPNMNSFLIKHKSRKQRLIKHAKREENLSGYALFEEGFKTLKISSSPLNNPISPCAVEGCLAKGFSGLFSSPPCVKNQE